MQIMLYVLKYKKGDITQLSIYLLKEKKKKTVIENHKSWYKRTTVSGFYASSLSTV